MPDINATHASYARTALDNVRREYPNFIMHFVHSATEAQGCVPSALHPIFYGSYDWHSCVHMHWSLARLLNLDSEATHSRAIVSWFDRQFDEGKARREAAYFDRDGGAHCRTHLLRIVGAGHAPGANGPHGLIGHHDRGQLLTQGVNDRLELSRNHELGLIGLTLSQGLTHTNDGHQAVSQSCLGLVCNQLVRLGMVAAALGVTDDRVSGTQLAEHEARHLAGVRTLSLSRHVL